MSDTNALQLRDGLHFIGIGGVGMSAVALVLAARGARVSGSDLKESGVTRRLREAGVKVFIGHGAANVAEASGVVISTAIDPGNPELLAARERGLGVWHRSQALNALLAARHSVGITGTHGKTTTTLMVGRILEKGGLDPTVLVGGWVDEYHGGARVGAGDWVVAEVDESDRSLLNIRPEVSLITNIDFDHPDHFRDREHVRAVFAEYVQNMPADGRLIVNMDDDGTRATMDRFDVDMTRCSLSDTGADARCGPIRLGAGKAAFDLILNGETLGIIELGVGGLHNVMNALQACAVGWQLGVSFEDCRTALQGFHGVCRRFELRGEAGGVRVYDDYAHHPKEILATLAVARSVVTEPEGRVVAIFQPHRYTRTQAMADEFAVCFGEADSVMIMEVYGAGDAPIAGVDGALVCRKVHEAGHRDVRYCPDFKSVAEAVAAIARPGDVVLTMGAGDVTNLADPLLEALGR